MRLSKKFTELDAKREKALMLYISCGDPSAEETVRIAREAIAVATTLALSWKPFKKSKTNAVTTKKISRNVNAVWSPDKILK